ncbi:sigma-70 family RNA polymerase sigma factor [Georgenia daeguensis]|uniref:RNA polymerase sigma factor n=1 Tax=Georgenia daeguensis TaxID=908355 RepID=A0ABP8EUA6_9MICO
MTQELASEGTTVLPAGARSLDDAVPLDWVATLRVPGPERDRALATLHALLERAARHQVHRMRHLLGAGDRATVDELTTAAADGALAALLAKLDTFEGRSLFTTWAYKFAILEAATEVRRRAWSGREVSLEGGERLTDPAPGPEQLVLAHDLADAVSLALDEALTEHQRRVAVALLVEQVPVDVLADRLGTTRGALYKTLHDARRRIRAHLTAAGYLPATSRTGAR